MKEILQRIFQKAKLLGPFYVVGLEHDCMGKSFKALYVKVGEMMRGQGERERERERERESY